MKLRKPVVDYRKLRPNNLTSPQFKHLFLLLIWVLYGIAFFIAENFHPATHYHDMYWPAVDDVIPFCEWFLIPYLFWFVYLVVIHIYMGLYDIEGFKKLMYFIGMTYFTAAILFFVWPTEQNLRPDLEALGRENFLTRLMAGFYNFDTNTNVAPSLHVVGSVAVWAAAFNCKALRKTGWNWFFGVSTVLISISTVFLKQHSVIDILVAIPLCALAYGIVYCRKKK